MATKQYLSAQPPELMETNRPLGWKYKSRKLGPFTLPSYASPETQLILVSFVCFLCPGENSCTTSPCL